MFGLQLNFGYARLGQWEELKGIHFITAGGLARLEDPQKLRTQRPAVAAIGPLGTLELVPVGPCPPFVMSISIQ